MILQAFHLIVDHRRFNNFQHNSSCAISRSVSKGGYGRVPQSMACQGPRSTKLDLCWPRCTLVWTRACRDFCVAFLRSQAPLLPSELVQTDAIASVLALDGFAVWMSLRSASHWAAMFHPSAHVDEHKYPFSGLLASRCLYLNVRSVACPGGTVAVDRVDRSLPTLNVVGIDAVSPPHNS